VQLFPSAVDVVVDLLQSKRSREVREERRIKRERIEEKLGASGSLRVTKSNGEAHWSGGSPTRKFAQPGGASEKLEEGKRGGRPWLYRGQNLEEGVGYRQEEEIERCGWFPCLPRSLAGAR
jgi:hypothetical protein